MSDDLNYLPASPATGVTRVRLTTLQKAEFLRGLELFSEASVEDLYQLAAIAQEVEFPAQQTIFREEDIGDAFYIVVQGKIECTSEARKIHVVVGPGGSVGVYSVLTREPRLATARALEDTFAIAIGAEDLYNLLSNNAEIMAGIIKFFVKKVGMAP